MIYPGQKAEEWLSEKGLRTTATLFSFAVRNFGVCLFSTSFLDLYTKLHVQKSWDQGYIALTSTSKDTLRSRTHRRLLRFMSLMH